MHITIEAINRETIALRCVDPSLQGKLYPAGKTGQRFSGKEVPLHRRFIFSPGVFSSQMLMNHNTYYHAEMQMRIFSGYYLL
jgi:hypothetical protein